MKARSSARTWVAWAAVAMAMAMAACGLATPRADRPLNVLVLVIDDARWDTLGVAGNRAIQTPRLDRLAAEGVRFEHAFVTTSICMVSRASILTGQYMSRHGIRAFGSPIAREAWPITYPGVLSAAGYWQGFVGKYGVGAARPEDFDFVRTYEQTHWFTEPGGEVVHVTEKNARDALTFLRSRPTDRPFALSVSFFAAHAEDNSPQQYQPQDWSADVYGTRLMPAPVHGAPRFLEALPHFLRQPSNEGRVRFGWRFDTPERYQDYLRRYYRMVTEVDQVVGRLLDELDAQGVADDTLVLYIGDNGYFQGDRGLADKWYPYDESIRVPFIVRDPRLPVSRRGLVADATALNIDVAPTVLGAAGAAIPARMQGLDLARVYLRDEASARRPEFFYEHPTITSKDRIPSSLAVVRRDVKYVQWPEWHYEQLFDLERDPDELVNLAQEPGHAAQRARLQQQLEGWQARVR